MISSFIVMIIKSCSWWFMFVVWKLLFLLHVVYVNGFTLSPLGHKKVISYRNQLSQVLDKDRSYCENPLHFLSVHDLVFYYGDRENWWGDLGIRKTRHLYHQLLPIYHSYYIVDYNIELLALKSYETRKAVKKYVRHRSYLYVRFFSIIIDTLRSLKRYKRLRPDGATYEDLWKKYEKQILKIEPHINQEELNYKIALTIVHKSCCTNKFIDYFCKN